MASGRGWLVAIAAMGVGCQQQVEECEGVSVDTTQSPNTISISWTSRQPVTSKVYYTIPGEKRREVTVAEKVSQEHSTTLVGMPAFSDIELDLVETGTRDEDRCAMTATTQNLPAELPDLQVEIHNKSLLSSENYILNVAMSMDVSYPFLVDRRGRWRWFWDHPLEVVPQVQMNEDKSDFLMVEYFRSVSVANFFAVSASGEELKGLEIPEAHHVFAVLPEGQMAFLVLDTRMWLNPDQGRSESVVGDAIVELDPETGEMKEIFSVWDWAVPEIHEYWYLDFYNQGADWTHTNALFYSQARNSYLVSMPYLETVLEIDRDTGEVLRDISADTYSFSDLPFHLPHDARLTDDGHLLIVNHYDEETIFVEYALDDEARTATVVWQHGRDLGRQAHILGQQLPLSNGNRLLSYGDLGLMQEVTLEGEEIWELWMPLGFWVGNGQALQSLDSL